MPNDVCSTADKLYFFVSQPGLKATISNVGGTPVSKSKMITMKGIPVADLSKRQKQLGSPAATSWVSTLAK